MQERKDYLQQCYEQAQYQEALNGYLSLLNSYQIPEERAELDYRIAQCYYKKGDFIKAKDFFHLALQNDVKPELMSRCYNELGTIFYKERRIDQAIESINKSLTLVKPETMDAAAAYNNLGRVYYRKHEYHKALFYFRMSMTIKERNLSMDDLEISVSYNNIGVVYMELGDYVQALRYLEIALSIRKKKLGNLHPDIGTTYNNIALTNMQMKQYDKAKRAFDKALKIRIEILGEMHLDTVMTYYGLAVLHCQLGKYKESKKLYEHVYHLLSNNATIEHDELERIANEIRKCEKSIEDRWETN